MEQDNSEARHFRRKIIPEQDNSEERRSQVLFQKKLHRVVNPEEAEQRFEERMEGQELEKNDRLAMILAGLIVFVPAMLLIIGVFLLGIWFFFGRFL